MKAPHETDLQYIWRLAEAKSAGLIDMAWPNLGELFNKELRKDDEPWWDESAYRKPYQNAKAYYEEVFSKMIDGQYSEEISKQTDELYKLKKQYFDQRREYNKLLTAESRADHLLEYVRSAAEKLNQIKPLKFQERMTDSISDNEAVLCLSDWHYGMTTDNIWNRYNTNICRDRVVYVISKAIDYIRFHKSKTLHVLLLGDCADGAIRTTSRVAAEEETCDQIMQVAEIIAEAVGKLAAAVPEVIVYSTYGNHLRTIQNKNDSIHSDNMEKLIPWWLKARFTDCPNISIIDSEFQEFLRLDVCGYKICATHGDLDNIKNLGVQVNTIFSKLYGETIDYTISGDKHHLEEFESFDIENILVRSLCGTDNYANTRRLYSNAGQTLMIFTPEDGRQCTYNIKIPMGMGKSDKR